MTQTIRTSGGDIYRQIVRRLPGDIILLLDEALHLIGAEGGDTHLLGPDPDAAQGKALTELISTSNLIELQSNCHAAIAGDARRFEIVSAGRVYEAHAVPVRDVTVPTAAVALTLHDITALRIDEHGRQRADRAYRTLSAGNRALLRSRTEAELLSEICEVAVETGGYLMAWVGLAERDEHKTLVPTAWAGREDGYLTARRLTWADTELGQGPASTSVRNSRQVIVQNIATDPAFDQWRGGAIQRGYASALSAPLMDDQHKAFGCVAFYSDEPDAFDSREAQLLVDLADGLAYGIRTLRNEAMRLTMVNALQESEARFRMLAENSFGGIYIIQEGRYIYVNPAFAKMFGFTRKEMLDGMQVSDRVHPDHQRRVEEALRQRIDGEVESVQYAVQCVRKDGSSVWMEALGSAVEWQGKPAVVGMAIDVTERIRIEQAEKEQRKLADALAATSASLLNILDITEVAHRLVTGVSQVVEYDHIVVMTGRDHVMREMFVRAGGAAGPLETPQSVSINVRDVPVLREVAHTCATLVVPDTADHAGWIAFPGTDGARSFAGAPVCFEKEMLGFLGVFSDTPDAYGETQGRVVQAFADQAANALRNIDLYRELNTYSEFLEDAIESATEEMRRAKEQMEAIVVNTPNPVLLLASDASIKLVNPAFEQLFGYDRGGLRGKLPAMLVAPRDQPVLDGAVQALAVQHVTMYLDLHAVRGDGGEFEVRMALAPILDGERLIGTVCDIHDVSSFKEVERLKDAFVSNVSHELRTPITSMRLNFSLMRRNPEKSETYLDRQMRDLDRLGQLIEDLLHLSRLDQGRGDIELKPLDLGAWAESLIDEYTILASENDLALTFEPLAAISPVNADGGFLRHVLGNLLANAINYTPHGGSIHVSMLRRGKDGKEWSGFRVADSGPGINAEDQERLFERFFRGRAGRSAPAPGTGLGLPIAREIVLLHSGEIEVESTGVPGEGTVFRVWLPAINTKKAR